MEQQSYELPEGWCLATLPKVVDENGLFTDGDWVESKDQDPSGDVRLIQLADIGVGEYRDRSSRFLTYDKAKELNCSFLRPNDILFARMPDPIGRACLFPGDEKQSVTVVDVAIIRPASKLVNVNWLVYQINSPQFYASVVALQKGATRKRISRKNLATIQFPLPPLNEQKCIVARLDALFTRIDAAINHLQETLELSKALFASVLGQAFNPLGETGEEYELPEVWKWDHLGQVLDVRDGTHDSPKYQQTGYPLVTSKNLTVAGLDLKNVKFISEEDFQQISKRSGVDKGDILFAMIGTIGNPIIIEDEPSFAIKNVALFKPRSESQCMQYFRYFLLSPNAIERMMSSSKGAAQKFVGLRVLRGFSVPIPPLSEQERIVAKLEELSERIHTLESETQERLDQLIALKSSLLDAAFRGQL
ncbi:MAG: restriction endonuclease subunit S [bacterium]